MTSEDCIRIIRNRLISLVNNGGLQATYSQSRSSISFYVRDIISGLRPMLTLRLSDHRPTYQKYIQNNLTPPSSGDDTNISIEFYKPKYGANGKRIKDRLRSGVSLMNNARNITTFSISSYKYMPRLLSQSDVDIIYNAIITWIQGGINSTYQDPFAGTNKAAKKVSKKADIKFKIPSNISISSHGKSKETKQNGYGADYVSESIVNRIVEEEIRRVVTECRPQRMQSRRLKIKQ